MTLDYLIVGAGLFGATLAHELKEAGRKVLVLEKESHPGGMCYSESRDGIIFQPHGPHIFHTNDRRLWDYVNRFTCWRHFMPVVMAESEGKFYSFPPNRMTYQQLGIDGLPPAEKEKVIRDKFYRGYTEKQWGRSYETMPKGILARIPIRENWDNRRFSHDYVGVPVSGYTELFDGLLDGVAVEYEADYLNRPAFHRLRADKLIYSGKPDALLDYQAGRLEYRSLRFETKRFEVEDYQGCPAINHVDRSVPFTRTMEHKHFFPVPRLKHTLVTWEYPQAHDGDNTPYYPLNDETNNAMYRRYRLHAQADGKMFLGGRLGSYKYMDMDQVIASALKLAKELLN